MNVIIRPSELVASLQSQIEEIRQPAEVMPLLRNELLAYGEEEKLHSVAFNAHRHYMSDGHGTVLFWMMQIATSLRTAHTRHISLINAHLDLSVIYNLAALDEIIDRLTRSIRAREREMAAATVAGGMFFGIIGLGAGIAVNRMIANNRDALVAERARYIRRREQLETYIRTTATIYSLPNSHLATLQRALQRITYGSQCPTTGMTVPLAWRELDAVVAQMRFENELNAILSRLQAGDGWDWNEIERLIRLPADEIGDGGFVALAMVLTQLESDDDVAKFLGLLADFNRNIANFMDPSIGVVGTMWTYCSDKLRNMQLALETQIAIAIYEELQSGEANTQIAQMMERADMLSFLGTIRTPLTGPVGASMPTIRIEPTIARGNRIGYTLVYHISRPLGHPEMSRTVPGSLSFSDTSHMFEQVVTARSPMSGNVAYRFIRTTFEENTAIRIRPNVANAVVNNVVGETLSEAIAAIPVVGQAASVAHGIISGSIQEYAEQNATLREVEAVFGAWALADLTRQFGLSATIITDTQNNVNVVVRPTNQTYTIVNNLNQAVSTLMQEGRMTYVNGVGLVIPSSVTGDSSDVVFLNLQYPITINNVSTNSREVQRLFEDKWIYGIMEDVNE